MAVYHLACRLVAEPNRPNPPARVAKWQQACALPTCCNMIWKGDMISCTRDNENGQRKGPRSTVPAPAAEEPEPPTHRDPFPILAAVAPDESQWVPRESLDCARRLLRDEERAHEATRAALQDARNVLSAIISAAEGFKS